MNKKGSRVLLVIVSIAWVGTVAAGLGYVWVYENSPSELAKAPALWPSESKILRRTNMPTLVLFIHPHCPCSRATIGELAILMAHAQGRVNANIQFVKPIGFPDSWGQSACGEALWPYRMSTWRSMTMPSKPKDSARELPDKRCFTTLKEN